MEKNPFSFLMGARLLKDFFGEELKTVGAAIKGRAVYTLDVTNNRWDIAWQDIRRYFPHMPADAEDIFEKVSSFKTDSFDKTIGVGVHNGTFTDLCMFRGTPIILVMALRVGDKEKDSVHFMTPRTEKNIHTLRSFVAMLMKRHLKRTSADDVRFVQVVDVVREELPGYRLKCMRSFENIFIPQEQKDAIRESLDKFIQGRQWYSDHKIPYHFGILLHGPAGTGKSSIINAIICQYKCRAIYINSGEMGTAFSRTNWTNTINIDGDEPNLIISEDIDVSSFTEKRKNEETKETTEINQLGKVINFMDGINSPENVIYVFTTNHIEKLDPALIRPGRIDLVLEIGYADIESMNQFLTFHFGKSMPKGTFVKKNVTFAAVQTDVMKGASFEEIIEKYCFE